MYDSYTSKFIFLLQRDLAGFASKMSECLAPETFPKTQIFCSTKSLACQILTFFKCNNVQGSFINMYHASLSEETKKAIYELFASPLSPLRCLVSTVAFGMVRQCNIHIITTATNFILIYMQGLDIADIQIVLLYGLPKSLSQCYQVSKSINLLYTVFCIYY